jgi:MFS family permease
VPQQIFLGTLVQSVVVVAASLIGGKLSDRTGRREIFALTASVVYGVALFVVAIASDFSGFLVGMAIGGLGFGIHVAVDLVLVVDVLPDKDNAAKDLGVFNMAALFRSPSRRGSRRPSWRSAAAATACCTWWPGSAPSSEPPRSCR